MIPPGPRRRSRLAVAALVGVATALATAASALALASHGGARTAAPPISIQIGDIVKVSGAPVGCIARLQNGVRALDCRRVGPLVGTYGTILTGRQVLVVRFETAKTAKIVFSAHHRQIRTHTCG
jgi:hypothetical protein